MSDVRTQVCRWKISFIKCYTNRNIAGNMRTHEGVHLPFLSQAMPR